MIIMPLILRIFKIQPQSFCLNYQMRVDTGVCRQLLIYKQ